jgi:hypothetical protein
VATQTGYFAAGLPAKPRPVGGDSNGMEPVGQAQAGFWLLVSGYWFLDSWLLALGSSFFSSLDPGSSFFLSSIFDPQTLSTIYHPLSTK